MAKIVRIESCYHCHWSRGGPVVFVCAYQGSLYELRKYPVIPDWCPLEDAPDETGMAVTGMRKGYRTGQAWETPDTGEEE